MRIATSSIPRDTLHKILMNQIDPKKLDDYIKIVRFYLESERYEQAKQILDGLLATFPNKADLKQELAASLRGSCSFRRSGSFGNWNSAAAPANTSWSGAAEALSHGRRRGRDPSEGPRTDAGLRNPHGQVQGGRQATPALAERLKDTIAKENLRPILDEIEAEINLNTIDRMAAFLQCAEDKQTPDAEKLALAVSGWLLGADSSKDKLPLAISAYKVRGLICKYLAEASVPERERIYRYMKQESAGDMATVASCWPT